MGHLRRDSDGHLLRAASGHLTSSCNACENCDPALPDVLSVTFGGGLAGDFTKAAGTWVLTWASACRWELNDEPVGGGKFLDIVLAHFAVPSWSAWFTVGDDDAQQVRCRLDFINTFGGGDNVCDEIDVDNYVRLACDDATCDDGNSCGNTINPTCTVSLV